MPKSENDKAVSLSTIYLSGPMTGVPEVNHSLAGL
jgi:hypothetical protein